MDFNQFLSLSVKDVAALVRQNGRQVVAFPFNGTRRWFQLEESKPTQDPLTAYHEAITRRQAEIIRMLFEHGIDTVLMPLLSPYLFESRGSHYAQSAIEALRYLTDQDNFLSLYQQQDVRVGFYGDYADYLVDSASAHLLERFQAVTSSTRSHTSHHLYWGICAHDSTKTAISLAIQYYKKFGAEPTRDQLVEMYYGAPVPPISIFISATKLRVFDVPLLSNGRENLYFTVAPSPYFSQVQLRSILYDHLFARQKETSAYTRMQTSDWESLRQFYHANKTNTLGVGKRLKEWGIWVPLPQVNLPKEPQNDKS